MFVTFFYPLQSSLRPPSVYYERYEKLLEALQGKSILVYSSDENIRDISKKFTNVKLKFFFLNNFKVWTQKDAIQACLKKKWLKFSVPEFNSAEYIALQLCKFEALYLASFEVLSHEPIIWIDAGLREHSLNSSFEVNWKKRGIHVTQFTAQPISEQFITTFPGSYIMGGCFGGRGVEIRQLYKETESLLKELWIQNICANDQQILSILHWRKPYLFHVQRSFTQYIPFYGAGNWTKPLQILDSETSEYYKNYQPFTCLIILLFYYLLQQNA